MHGGKKVTDLLELLKYVEKKTVGQEAEEERVSREETALTAVSRAREREIKLTSEINHLIEENQQLKTRIQNFENGFRNEEPTNERNLSDFNQFSGNQVHKEWEDTQYETEVSANSQKEKSCNYGDSANNITRKKIPDLLQTNQLKWEFAERRKRRCWIKVVGFRATIGQYGAFHVK